MWSEFTCWHHGEVKMYFWRHQLQLRDSGVGVWTIKGVLETHLQFAHPTQDGGNNDRKPEKFPRPDLKLDSSAEEWSKFLNF